DDRLLHQTLRGSLRISARRGARLLDHDGECADFVGARAAPQRHRRAPRGGNLERLHHRRQQCPAAQIRRAPAGAAAQEKTAFLTCRPRNYNLSLIRPGWSAAMPYATQRVCYDADSHIMETRDWIAHSTDQKIRAKLPEMSWLRSGTKSFDIINEAVLRQNQRPAAGAGAVDVVRGQ